MAADRFHLGGDIEPASGERTGDDTTYDAGDLTTHGVIVGMTGSGKTGLGIIYLEEALRAGIPALILDPKGDMTNLLLTFPDLAPADFEPWVDRAEAEREGITVEALAEKTAELWKSGLASWDLDGSDIGSLRGSAGFTIYTPGSSAGVPMNVLGSLASPDVDWDSDAETARDEIEGLVSGILALVGVDADPLAGREHILLSNLVEQAWRDGDDLTIEDLIARVHLPPMRKLGVFEMDAFFPEKDRLALAMRLNTLVASPSFAEWRSGPPLDPERLLWAEDGTPQASIVYLAHLSDDQRQFVVTTILGRLVTWMRSQPGSSDLRAMVYMDEVFGFVPPSAMPPAKKPILTLMKQARAFGIGMLLSTQNPVDLDYKAMSNAGTWLIGRLQTERDKARILEALETASGDADVSALDKVISGLGKRQFLLHTTRGSKPRVFTTRWAMSYLRGPLTRDEVARLVGSDERKEIRSPAPQNATSSGDSTPLAPQTAPGTPVRYLDPAAEWAAEIGARRGSTRYAPGMAIRVHLTFDDTRAGVDHDEEWEAVFFPLTEPLDPSTAIAVDHDERDFLAEPQGDAEYMVPDAPIGESGYFSDAAKAIQSHLHRVRSVEVFRNPALKLYGRVGESRDEFVNRCEDAAERAVDEQIAKLRDRYATRIERARDEIVAADRKVQEARLDVETRRQEELASGAGTLIGVLLGNRRPSSMSTAASKRSMTRKAEQRLSSAEARMTKETEDVEQLEADLEREFGEIQAEWREKAEAIETLDIDLEKTDIHVEDPILVWIPV
ncbi:MAG TPA: DUF87 domain-containing protein [Acidimicrobiia bacterium]|nr:DUF87 domain-containing protein [Acidimicrobiia bacterium]